MGDRIAIIGGTGAEGCGLALRFARAGAQVSIGSRDAAKAQETAATIGNNCEGLGNAQAASQAGIVILTLPIQAQIATIKSIRDALRPGTVVVDATVPLEIAVGGRLSHPLQLWAGSAAEQAARQLGDAIPVVSAFHFLSADLLAQIDRPLDSDVLMCSDNADAKNRVRALVDMIPGARAVDAGPLENARMVEHAAALVIALNLRHKSKHGGIRITGLEPRS